MKRTAISLLLALALVLCAVLVTAPQAEAATQPCSGDHTGWTALPTEGGSLATGNYYVAESATLAATITIPADAEVTICLAGKTLTAPAAKRAVNMTKAGATLKICDCSGTHAGTIQANGAYAGTGGLIYVNKEGAVAELYSGTINGGGATGGSRHGGNVAVNGGEFIMHDGIISNGTADAEKGWGGNLYAINNSTITINGGVVKGGSAPLRGDNIYIHSKSNLILNGGSVIEPKGTCATNIQIGDSGKLYGTKLFDDLDAAVEARKVTIDGIVHMGLWNGLTTRAETFKLYSDIPSTYKAVFGEHDIYLDLNSHKFEGKFDASTTTYKNMLANVGKENEGPNPSIDIPGQLTLFVFDSTSDFDTVGTGVYSGEIINVPASEKGYTIKKADNGAALKDRGYERYLEINGTYQRFSLSIDAVSLELDANGNVDMGYSALIKGNSAVKGALSGFGIYVGKAETYETGKHTKAKEAADFVAGAAGNKVTLRVNDVMTAGNNANKDADVKVQAFIKVGNTEIVGNDAVSVSVQDVVDAAAKQLTEKPEEAATYPEFYALIEEIKTKYSITVTVEETPAA